MLTRIIAVTAHKPGLHSKFAIRLNHVRSTLIPSLAAIGLQPEIFPAIIGSDIKRSVSQAWYDGLTVGLSTHSGCIGNLFSNYELWKLSVRANEPVLILEDDASLPASNAPFVQDALKFFCSAPSRQDVLYLLGQSPSIKDSIRHYELSQLAPISAHLARLLHTEDLSCTAAYAVTPAAAQRLIGRLNGSLLVPTDGYLHTAQKEGAIGVIVQRDPKRGFMLNDNWADWNHRHDPSLIPK